MSPNTRSLNDQTSQNSKTPVVSKPPWSQDKGPLSNDLSRQLPINLKSIHDVIERQKSLNSPNPMGGNNINSVNNIIESATHYYNKLSLNSSKQRSQWSTNTDSDSNDPYDNPLIKKLKKQSVFFDEDRSNNKTFSSSYSSDLSLGPFFPPQQQTTDSSQSNSILQVCGNSSKKPEERIHTFDHYFSWKKNIDHGSAWAFHRAREIWEYVVKHQRNVEWARRNNLNNNVSNEESKIRDIDLTNNNAVAANDTIVYNMAKKICDTLTENSVIDDECLQNDNNKWAILYQKLVKCGLLEN